jgi:hypothetical protein
MDIHERIAAFDKLRIELGNIINDPAKHLILKACRHNSWFTAESVTMSVASVAEWLEKDVLEAWTDNYNLNDIVQKRIGLILAGNIPLVGFHDFLTVLLAGHIAVVKCSKNDNILLPEIADKLNNINPGFKNCFEFVDQLNDPDAVIATGSNNSARYFEYYFGKYPHIIRKNRNSIGILNGKESKEDLENLGKDIFTYFGLGCRNVSKLYIPLNYNFNSFFEAINKYSDVMHHNKYMNNFDYHNVVYLLNNEKFLTNNFLIVKENEMLPTPVSVLHYEYYADENDLSQKLYKVKEQVQCIVGKNFLPFGSSQEPKVTDYADGIDTMKFLSQLK